MDDHPNLYIFRKRLSYFRRVRRLSQNDLADLTGISNRMIAHYETRAIHPPLKKINILSKVLKVSVEELISTKPLHTKEPINRRAWKILEMIEKLPTSAQKKVLEYAKQFTPLKKFR